MKTEEYADLVIPELEKAELRITHPRWTAREDAILRKYYNTRAIDGIERYFAKADIPRNKGAIVSRAHSLKLLVSKKSDA